MASVVVFNARGSTAASQCTAGRGLGLEGDTPPSAEGSLEGKRWKTEPVKETLVYILVSIYFFQNGHISNLRICETCYARHPTPTPNSFDFSALFETVPCFVSSGITFPE
ncbi:hypothetical protein AVEN_165112-1 [Araneus ventricosus]|uniref:Uncharacterized protein n=1 Tax=Araneus ventricosus TaxID=182803 RepID=A0A4Y2L000_ARAVE|nr:hypothetical protein AVEN_165112-1 [Araneus ventricosus]